MALQTITKYIRVPNYEANFTHAGSKDPLYTNPLQEEHASIGTEQPSVIYIQEASTSSSDISQHPSNYSTIQDIKRKLERKFSCVKMGLINSDVVTVESLLDWVSTFDSFQSAASGPLLNTTNKREFFHELKNYCSSLNPEILEDLVDALGDEETKKKLNDFTQESQKVQQMRLGDLIGYFEGSDFMPPGYQELKLKLGENWRDKTLADLKRMKERMSVKHWILKLIEDGSITVTYLVPDSETLLLRDYCQSQNVLQITMGGEHVLGLGFEGNNVGFV